MENNYSLSMYNEPTAYTFLDSSDQKASEIFTSILFKLPFEGQIQPGINNGVNRKSFFIWFISIEPHRIALKFLSIAQSTEVTSTIRHMFILFLYSLFTCRVLTIPNHTDLKPILLSALQQETSMAAFTTLSGIISMLLSCLFEVEDFNEDWVELLDYIRFLLVNDVNKGFLVISELPLNMKGPLYPKNYRYGFLSVIFSHLKNTSNEDEYLWVLAFCATYTISLQLVICNERDYLMPNIEERIMNAVSELVGYGKQVYVQKGFQCIDNFREKERHNGSYSERVTIFINNLAEKVYRFPGVSDETKNVVFKFTRFCPTHFAAP